MSDQVNSIPKKNVPSKAVKLLGMEKKQIERVKALSTLGVTEFAVKQEQQTQQEKHNEPKQIKSV